MNLYSPADCPSNIPFLDEINNCKACSNDQIYDISQKTCKICEAGAFYNSIAHQCDRVGVMINSKQTDNGNYLGTPPNFNNQISSCLNDKPYFNGKSCISCSLPMYFSFKTNLC